MGRQKRQAVKQQQKYKRRKKLQKARAANAAAEVQKPAV